MEPIALSKFTGVIVAVVRFLLSPLATKRLEAFVVLRRVDGTLSRSHYLLFDDGTHSKVPDARGILPIAERFLHTLADVVEVGTDKRVKSIRLTPAPGTRKIEVFIP
jgi:hypothetical protein